MRPLPRIRTARDVREEAAYYTDQSLEAFTVKNVQKSTLVRKLYGVLQHKVQSGCFFLMLGYTLQALQNNCTTALQL